MQFTLLFLLLRFAATWASCAPDEFACSTGGQCIPRIKWQDDVEDCWDGSDEREFFLLFIVLRAIAVRFLLIRLSLSVNPFLVVPPLSSVICSVRVQSTHSSLLYCAVSSSLLEGRLPAITPFWHTCMPPNERRRPTRTVDLERRTEQ
ncbi:hypothetical protein RB195_010572 [Necator americanus]|uniref:Low-density lipoprotein receptor domain class A n=1 Tax=Necator americanus TaxID=51031 RepID=A0ABR1D1V2_NECAM